MIPRRPRLVLYGHALLCAMALTACQATPSPDNHTSVAGGPQGTAGLAAVPACAGGMNATLAGGATVTYAGNDPRDAGLCVLRWSGRSHDLYYGFWSATSPNEMTDEARQAFRSALTGPVGTETAFNATHARMWRSVTITHASNGTVTIAGKPRPALEFKTVQHDAEGRSPVRAEIHHWIDRATGVLLRQQSVTPMRDGGQMVSTTWELDALHPSG
jgi:hypothetical protein